MKLLLTGLPRTGKTTLFQKLISLLDDPFWIVSEEIRNEANERIGFKAKTSNGEEGVFAHKKDIVSDHHIGDYAVDLNQIDRLFSQPLENFEGDQFIAIDEIGRMQILSANFLQAIRKTFSSDVNIFATIRYGDDWTKEFTDREGVITFILTEENRTSIEEYITAALKADAYIKKLNPSQIAEVYRLAKSFLANDQYIQFKKLFNQSVKYVVDNRVQKENETSYIVQGFHGGYEVNMEEGKWECTCDLFNGRGDFVGKAGDCSHIFASKLSKL